jgi:hypothetical protein
VASVEREAARRAAGQARGGAVWGGRRSCGRPRASRRSVEAQVRAVVGPTSVARAAIRGAGASRATGAAQAPMQLQSPWLCWSDGADGTGASWPACAWAACGSAASAPATHGASTGHGWASGSNCPPTAGEAIRRSAATCRRAHRRTEIMAPKVARYQAQWEAPRRRAAAAPGGRPGRQLRSPDG